MRPVAISTVALGLGAVGQPLPWRSSAWTIIRSELRKELVNHHRSRCREYVFDSCDEVSLIDR